MARLDIDGLKAAVSFEQVFAHYGIEILGTSGNELTIRCPFHDDSKPSLKANNRNKVFNCFAGCGAKGDIIEFVRRKEGIESGERNRDRVETARLMRDWFGIAVSSANGSDRDNNANSTESNVSESADRADDTVIEDVSGEGEHDAAEPEHQEAESEPNPVLTFTLKLDLEHPYLKERGLQPETIAQFGLGFCNRGMMKGRIAIPIHNEQGELVAYAGRSLGELPEGEPKYLLPPHFRKSLVLFNLHRAREHAGEGLIVVEGFFSVLDLWQKGRWNTVAVMGNALSSAQERLIVETIGPKGRVLIAFDRDEAGRRGARDAGERLISQVFVRRVEL